MGRAGSAGQVRAGWFEETQDNADLTKHNKKHASVRSSSEIQLNQFKSI